MLRYLLYVGKDAEPDIIKKFDCIKRPIFRYRTKDIEVDVHVDDQRCIAEMSKFISINETEEFDSEKLQESLDKQDENDIMNNVAALFSDEKYWEAHEVLESLWKRSKGDEKKFYRGLILLCASMVHYQMLSFDKAIEVFNNAARILSSIRGVNVRIPRSFIYPIPFPL
ncbi:MAG: DUF309 domain-containing protein [Thermoplasmata archaeon]